jgi:hypothetical protein
VAASGQEGDVNEVDELADAAEALVEEYARYAFRNEDSIGDDATFKRLAAAVKAYRGGASGIRTQDAPVDA